MKLLLWWALLPALAQANVNDIFAELFGRPDRGGVKASYSLQQYETKGIKQSPDKISLRQHRGEASVPLSALSDKKWKLGFTANNDEIRSAARFPNGKPLPNSLWQAGASVSHLRMLANDRTLGASFFAGSYSDQPFGAARDLSFQGNLVYKIPGEDESAWLLFVNFSNTRGFLNYIPLPGAAYFFRAHPRLRLALGLPFVNVFWTPVDKLIVNLSYFPLYNAQAKVSYFFFGPAHAYVQAKYHSENYLLHDRRDKKERLFYEEALVNTGLMMPLERNILVDATIGYAFDRKYFLGKSSSARGDGQLRRPDHAPYASLKLVGSF
jgi:hypothetical protein